MVASAQAMFYPANGRNSEISGKLRSNIQPMTAWDTLQWKNQTPGTTPVFKTPEWGDPTPSKGPDSWNYSKMLTHHNLTLENGKLNLSWRAMLCPVSQDRLDKISQENTTEPLIKNMADTLKDNIDIVQY